jgi:hypothetical protein
LVAFAFPAVLLMGLTLALLRDIRQSIRAQRPAERRGIALLRSWLTPEQAKQWDSCREFDVIGGETGTRYRITPGTAMNIRQLDSVGHTIAEWFRARGQARYRRCVAGTEDRPGNDGTSGTCIGEQPDLTVPAALMSRPLPSAAFALAFE